MKLIGHRGCYYPGYNQNTIRAFQKVVDEGVPAIEFDVQLCEDKELVIVHNLDLEEVSTGTGSVSQTPSRELKQLYAGKLERGEDKIPFLEEVLEFFASIEGPKRPGIHLELKGDNTGTPTGELMKSFLESGKLDLDDFLVSSFNWQELWAIRALHPELKIALLDGAIHRSKLIPKLPVGSEQYFEDVFAYGNEDYMLPRYDTVEENIALIKSKCADKTIALLLIEEVQDCLAGAYYTDELLEAASAANASSVNLWFRSLHGDFVQKAHAKDLAVFVYTINKDEELLALAEMGVDGIFTDYYTHATEVLKDYL